MIDRSVPRPSTREQRGLELYLAGHVDRISRDVYLVDSATRRRENYVVDLSGDGRCECADNRRGHHCKHLFAARLYRAWIRRAARTLTYSL